MTANFNPFRGPAQAGAGWPTTLRFSRRLGERWRDADYASAIEGPDQRPVPQFLVASGLVHRLAARVARALARS